MRAEGTLQVEVHVVGEHRHRVEDEDASRNVGNVNREREDTVRLKSVASSCRSLGRCLPVLGIVAGEGYSHCAPRGVPVGSRVAAPAACCALRELHAPLPRGPLTVLWSLPSHPGARSESTCAEECLSSLAVRFWGSVPFRPGVSPREVKSHPTHGVQRLEMLNSCPSSCLVSWREAASRQPPPPSVVTQLQRPRHCTGKKGQRRASERAPLQPPLDRQRGRGAGVYKVHRRTRATR